jgi:FADH2 O2-dependent halogenase
MTNGQVGKARLDCDIAIIGSGIASSLLGMILASRGLDAVLIEKGHHPKFAIGESTIPQTSLMLKILGARYGIPELDHISAFEEIVASVTPSCGKKSNFGYIFHRPGQPHQLDECHQLGVAREGCSESHLFRQDIDSYLLVAAVRHGCRLFQRTDIAEVEIDDRGVTIETNRNMTIRARFLVDGGGYDSLLAKRLDLREKPTSIRTQSRTLFTHMIDVRPFDDCVEHDESGLGKLAPWHQGTLHHIFRDGWMWVIPFQNHPQSINPICSVGLQLDPRKHPKPAGVDPYDEFKQLISDYPEIARQFESATPVREWVSSGRLQYASSRMVGDRWCRLSHSSGFVDPLFSRGLQNSVEIISLTAKLLLEAAASDDFSEEKLKPIATLQANTVAANDMLVNGAYIAFRDIRLWNAWFRIWGLTQVYGVTRLLRSLFLFEETGNRSAFERLDRPLRPGTLAPDHPPVVDLIEEAYGAMLAFESGQLSAEQAESRVFELLGRADDLPPTFPFADKSVRFGSRSTRTQLAGESWLYQQMKAVA